MRSTKSANLIGHIKLLSWRQLDGCSVPFLSLRRVWLTRLQLGADIDILRHVARMFWRRVTGIWMPDVYFPRNLEIACAFSESRDCATTVALSLLRRRACAETISEKLLKTCLTQDVVRRPAIKVWISYNGRNTGTRCVPEMTNNTRKSWLTVSVKVRFNCRWHN